VLGVKSDASEADIKRIFRQLATKQHPDKGGNQEEFQRALRAYEVLTDKDLRKAYDEGGEEAVGVLEEARLTMTSEESTQATRLRKQRETYGEGAAQRRHNQWLTAEAKKEAGAALVAALAERAVALQKTKKKAMRKEQRSARDQRKDAAARDKAVNAMINDHPEMTQAAAEAAVDAKKAGEEQAWAAWVARDPSDPVWPTPLESDHKGTWVISDLQRRRELDRGTSGPWKDPYLVQKDTYSSSEEEEEEKEEPEPIGVNTAPSLSIKAGARNSSKPKILPGGKYVWPTNMDTPSLNPDGTPVVWG